ncbi:MAG: cyclic nucleotide-binding domain-containing protein [Verrucomicrobia bacterium]|nr:cyclic nucleotide-binding domain-containing protein [Verrucomicrobiota bacterium]
MNDHYASIMKTFSFLQGFTLAGAQMLMESGEIKSYGPGEVLLREHDPATFALMVLEGQLEVFVERDGRDLIVREVGPGNVIGEIAVLCRSLRSASVRAAQKSTVLQWKAEAFSVLLLRHPIFAERVLRDALSTLVEREQALIAELVKAREGHDAKP